MPDKSLRLPDGRTLRFRSNARVILIDYFRPSPDGAAREANLKVEQDGQSVYVTVPAPEGEAVEETKAKALRKAGQHFALRKAASVRGEQE